MNNIFSNKKYPLEERMVLFVYLTMMLSTAVIIVLNIATHYPMANNVKWLAFIVFIAIAAYFYIRKENLRRLIRNITFIFTIFAVFPVMFIISGGLGHRPYRI